jgi:hypothetical protein
MDFFSGLPPLGSETFPYLILLFCMLEVRPSVRLALCIYRNRHVFKAKYWAILSFLSSTDKKVKTILNYLGYAPGPFIYINSWPGVGKYTIAKGLASQLDKHAQVVRIPMIIHPT